MKRTVILVLAIVLSVGLLSSLASAFTMSEKVVVAYNLCAISRVPAGGFTADQRIDRVNERLAYILGYEPLNPGSIYARRFGADRGIYVGSRLLMTVTTSDARANHTTVAGLTSRWLRYFRRALPQARPNANIPVPSG